MKNFKRVLSLALAALMVIGGLVVAPVDAKAAETYNLVPGHVNAIKACIEDGGKFVLVAKYDNKYYALGQTYTKYRINPVEVNVTDDVLTQIDGGATIPEWSMEVKGNGVALYYDTTYIKYYGSSTTFSEVEKADAEEWTIGKEDGLFSFTASSTLAASTVRGIGYQASGNIFGAYATSNDDNGYEFDLMVFYKGAIPSFEEDPVIYESDEEVVEAAYALQENESINNISVTGVITSIDTPYHESYKNITLTIQVGDLVEKPLLCFRLKGTDADKLAPGDTITVSGNIVNFGGTIEFNAGCTFTDLSKGTLTNVTIPENASDADIINLMKEVEVGVSALGNQTLDGTVKEIKTAYDSEKKTITVTMDVEGTTVECYKAYGEEVANVVAGDKLTVTGKLIMTENGLRLDNDSIDARVTPTPTPDDDIGATGDFSIVLPFVLVLMGGAIVIVASKKRFA